MRGPNRPLKMQIDLSLVMPKPTLASPPRPSPFFHRCVFFFYYSRGPPEPQETGLRGAAQKLWERDTMHGLAGCLCGQARLCWGIVDSREENKIVEGNSCPRG
jgi:hypothetical protein